MSANMVTPNNWQSCEDEYFGPQPPPLPPDENGKLWVTANELQQRLIHCGVHRFTLSLENDIESALKNVYRFR